MILIQSESSQNTLRSDDLLHFAFAFVNFIYVLVDFDVISFDLVSLNHDFVPLPPFYFIIILIFRAAVYCMPHCLSNN